MDAPRRVPKDALYLWAAPGERPTRSAGMLTVAAAERLGYRATGTVCARYGSVLMVRILDVMLLEAPEAPGVRNGR